MKSNIPLTNITLLLNLVLLAYSSPLNYAPVLELEEQVGNTTISEQLDKRAPPKAGSGTSKPVVIKSSELVKHWNDMKGGLPDDALHYINPNEATFPSYLIEDKKGKKLPLVQLNCQNGYARSLYPGNFHEICMNFCWYRHCDPTTKKTEDQPKYTKFTRSESNSNDVRRQAGGYATGVNGPCSLANKGVSQNFFHNNDPTRTSLEEFPMAFMEQGGITSIEETGHKIGSIKLLDDVQRSPTYRCIAQKENSAAGSRIIGIVKQKQITFGDEFFFDVYNYNDIDWCNPNTKCKADPYQFVGLKAMTAADTAASPPPAEPAAPASGTPPQSPAPGTLPQTPPGQGIPAPGTPGRPKKAPATEGQLLSWLKNSEAILWKNNQVPPSDDWVPDGTDTNDDDESHIYPKPPATEDTIDNVLQPYKWQYFGWKTQNPQALVDGTASQGGHKILQFIDADAELAAAAAYSLDIGTPSKPGPS